MSSIDDRLTQIIRELIANGITLEQAVEAFECKYIAVAMAANQGNVTRASQLLGVHRNTVHNKLRTQSRLNGYVAALRPRKSVKKAAPARGASRARSKRK
ncbi:MAG: helix-turn-helix domain-containing protein [Thermoanaerobaculia bacterium]